MKICQQHIKRSIKQMQNYLEKEKMKKTCTNFVRKRPWVTLVQNFELNQMSACVHENLQIAHLEVQETNAKFFRKNKKKTRTNLVRKRQRVRFVYNFDLNQMSTCQLGNLQIAHLEVQVKMQNSLGGEKKKLMPILYENTPESDQFRILT